MHIYIEQMSGISHVNIINYKSNLKTGQRKISRALIWKNIQAEAYNEIFLKQWKHHEEKYIKKTLAKHKLPTGNIDNLKYWNIKNWQLDLFLSTVIISHQPLSRHLSKTRKWATSV